MRAPAPRVAQVQVVAFRLGADEFGLDVFAVHEILRYEPVRAVPRAPAFVEGVIDVRGALVPVVDLRRRFEVAADAPGAESRIVIVQFAGERLGLIVDAVSEVLRVAETAVSAAPAYFRGLAAEYIRGIVRLPERLIIVLEIESILSSQERIALDAADLAAADADVAADAGQNALPAAPAE